MAFYSQVFTVPKNTPEATPYEETFTVIGGVIHQISVVIPSGHQGLTGCAIYQGLHQLAPTTQGEWYTGDDNHYLYPEFIEIVPDENELILKGYNIDDTYNHGFIVSVGVLPANILLPLLDLNKSLEPILTSIQGIMTFFSTKTP